MGIATYSYNRSTSGGEIIRELVNASDGQGLHFDGAAGNIDIATPPDLGTKFSFEFIVQADSWADSTYKILVGFGSAGRFIIGTADTAGAKLSIFDNTSWKTFGVAPLDDLKVHHLVFTIDGTAATLYDNGNQVGTATISASHNLDNCADAKIGSDFDGTSDAFNGTIYRTRFWNKTLSSAEVTATYENATVPTIDRYGSAASKLLNGTAWTGASGHTLPNNWTVGVDGTWTIDSSSGSGSEPALKIQRNGVNNFPYMYQTFTAEIGKKYRVKYRVKNIDATNVIVGIGSSAVGTQYNTSSYSSTSWADFEETYTATTTTFSVYVQAYTNTATNGGYIDSLVVDQIGCVADYDLAFANPTQSLLVQNRAAAGASPAADGTASSGVTQVTPIEQLNSKSARIGTSAATPADGQLMVSGPLNVGGSTGTQTIQVESTNGYAQLKAISGSHIREWSVDTAGNFYVWQTNNSLRPLNIDSAGVVTANNQIKVQNDTASLRVQSNTTPTKGAALSYDHAGSFGQLLVDEQGVNQLAMKYYALSHTFGRSDGLQYATIDSAGAVTIGSAGSAGSAKVYGATNGNPLTIYEDTNDHITHNCHLDASDNAGLIMYAAAQAPKVSIQTAGASYFNGGPVTMPSTPAFSAVPSAAQDNLAVAPAVVDIVLGTEIFDQGANFASNTFTAPVAGRYQLNAILGLVYIDSAADFYQIQIATSNRTYTYTFDPDFGQDAVYWEFGPSVLADMDASDTAVMRFYQSGGTAQTDVSTVRTYFNGYLAC